MSPNSAGTAVSGYLPGEEPGVRAPAVLLQLLEASFEQVLRPHDGRGGLGEHFAIHGLRLPPLYDIKVAQRIHQRLRCVLSLPVLLAADGLQPSQLRAACPDFSGLELKFALAVGTADVVQARRLARHVFGAPEHRAFLTGSSL